MILLHGRSTTSLIRWHLVGVLICAPLSQQGSKNHDGIFGRMGTRVRVGCVKIFSESRFSICHPGFATANWWVCAGNGRNHTVHHPPSAGMFIVPKNSRPATHRESGSREIIVTAVVISIDRFLQNRPKIFVYLLIVLGLGTPA